MARGKQVQTQRAVVAAAQRIPLTDRAQAQRLAAVGQPWQQDAWDAFNEVPEIGESLTYRGDLMAQLRLFPAVADPDNPEGDPIPLADERAGAPPEVLAAANAELARLATRYGGQAEVLRQYEVNMQVAGELYLVGLAATDTEPEEWMVRSTSEVSAKEGVFTLLAKPGDPDGRQLSSELDFIERIWTPHPQWYYLPDSPLRRLRTDTRAAITLNEQVITESLSTLPAGLFLLPNEVEFDWPAGYQPTGSDAERDPFLVMLERAIQDGMDPQSFASQFPLVIRGPAEYLKPEYVRRVSLAREEATTTEGRLAARVERIARGLPLPVEKVMGHQQTTFANARQVDRDEFDDYLKPSATTMVRALSSVFYIPHLLENPAVPEAWATRIVLWYDPTALIAEPDPVESADTGAAEGYISPRAWREKKGWTEEDAPDALELLARMAYRKGTLDPTLTAQLLADLAVEAGLDLAPGAVDSMANASPQEAAAFVLLWQQARTRGQPPPLPKPQLIALTAGAALTAREVPGGADLLVIDQQLRARWMALLDAALNRALEKAGNRLRNLARKLNAQAALQAPPLMVGALLGEPAVTAAADELGDLWDWSALEGDFRKLGAQAQGQALEAASIISSGFSTAQRTNLKLRQAADLDEAWDWTKGAMSSLAQARLYNPETGGLFVGPGESDPTMKLPAGLVRQAMAVAGGSPTQLVTAATAATGEAWINPGAHLAGVGVGERIRDAMASEGVTVKSYRWVYGPALRAHPFQPHLNLDGITFSSFTDPKLANSFGWPYRSHFLPGDHPGCVCDVEPILQAVKRGPTKPAAPAPEAPAAAPTPPAAPAVELPPLMEDGKYAYVDEPLAEAEKGRMRAGDLKPAEREVLEALEKAQNGKDPKWVTKELEAGLEGDPMDGATTSLLLKDAGLTEVRRIQPAGWAAPKSQTFITDYGKEVLAKARGVPSSAAELADLPTGAGELLPAHEQLLARTVRGTMTPEGRQLILGKLDEALGPAPSGAKWSTVLGQEKLELTDRLGLRARGFSTKTDLRWEPRFITAEPVDPQKVWDMARERVRWAASTQGDPVVVVKVQVQGEQYPFEVMLRGSDRVMASIEQRVPGVAFRAETLDHTVKLTAEEWAQVKPKLYSYGAQQEAIAARPDILGEAKLAREAKRAALGPMPTNLKSSKAYTEAFLERWGDRGLEKPDLVADFSYMTTEGARQVSTQLDAMMREFPNTAENLWATGSQATMKKVPGMPLQLQRIQADDTYADASSVGTLRWNSKWFGKSGKMRQYHHVEKNAANPVRANGFRFHVPVGPEVSAARATVAHEFGHLMDYTAMGRQAGKAMARDRAGEYKARLYAILDRHLQAANAGRRPEGMLTLPELVSQEVSEYGAFKVEKEAFELVAESVCEAMMSPNPRPLAREIFELVREYAEGVPASS